MAPITISVGFLTRGSRHRPRVTNHAEVEANTEETLLALVRRLHGDDQFRPEVFRVFLRGRQLDLNGTLATNNVVSGASIQVVQIPGEYPAVTDWNLPMLVNGEMDTRAPYPLNRFVLSVVQPVISNPTELDTFVRNLAESLIMCYGVDGDVQLRQNFPAAGDVSYDINFTGAAGTQTVAKNIYDSIAVLLMQQIKTLDVIDSLVLPSLEKFTAGVHVLEAEFDILVDELLDDLMRIEGYRYTPLGSIDVASVRQDALYDKLMLPPCPHRLQYVHSLAVTSLMLTDYNRLLDAIDFVNAEVQSYTALHRNIVNTEFNRTPNACSYFAVFARIMSRLTQRRGQWESMLSDLSVDYNDLHPSQRHMRPIQTWQPFGHITPDGITDVNPDITLTVVFTSSAGRVVVDPGEFTVPQFSVFHHVTAFESFEDFVGTVTLDLHVNDTGQPMVGPRIGAAAARGAGGAARGAGPNRPPAPTRFPPNFDPQRGRPPHYVGGARQMVVVRPAGHMPGRHRVQQFVFQPNPAMPPPNGAPRPNPNPPPRPNPATAVFRQRIGRLFGRNSRDGQQPQPSSSSAGGGLSSSAPTSSSSLTVQYNGTPVTVSANSGVLPVSSMLGDLFGSTSSSPRASTGDSTSGTQSATSSQQSETNETPSATSSRPNERDIDAEARRASNEQVRRDALAMANSLRRLDEATLSSAIAANPRNPADYAPTLPPGHVSNRGRQRPTPRGPSTDPRLADLEEILNDPRNNQNMGMISVNAEIIDMLADAPERYPDRFMRNANAGILYVTPMGEYRRVVGPRERIFQTLRASPTPTDDEQDEPHAAVTITPAAFNLNFNRIPPNMVISRYFGSAAVTYFITNTRRYGDPRGQNGDEYRHVLPVRGSRHHPVYFFVHRGGYRAPVHYPSQPLFFSEMTNVDIVPGYNLHEEAKRFIQRYSSALLKIGDLSTSLTQWGDRRVNNVEDLKALLERYMRGIVAVNTGRPFAPNEIITEIREQGLVSPVSRRTHAERLTEFLSIVGDRELRRLIDATPNMISSAGFLQFIYRVFLRSVSHENLLELIQDAPIGLAHLRSALRDTANSLSGNNNVQALAVCRAEKENVLRQPPFKLVHSNTSLIETWDHIDAHFINGFLDLLNNLIPDTEFATVFVERLGQYFNTMAAFALFASGGFSHAYFEFFRRLILDSVPTNDKLILYVRQIVYSAVCVFNTPRLGSTLNTEVLSQFLAPETNDQSSDESDSSLGTPPPIPESDFIVQEVAARIDAYHASLSSSPGPSSGLNPNIGGFRDEDVE